MVTTHLRIRRHLDNSTFRRPNTTVHRAVTMTIRVLLAPVRTACLVYRSHRMKTQQRRI